MYSSHPLRVTLCQIIIDCYYMYALSFKSIQVSRHGRNKCFTFTCTHLRKSSLMKNYTTDNLNPIRSHAKNSPCSLSYNCKCINKDIIQCLAICKCSLKLISLSSKHVISEVFATIFVLKSHNLINKRVNLLQLAVTICTKYFINK